MNKAINSITFILAQLMLFLPYTYSQNLNEAIINIKRLDNNLIITWNGILQSSDNAAGPYKDVETLKNGYLILAPHQSKNKFFRAVITEKKHDNIHLIINELMASNDTIITDSDGDSSDWFEIYNTSESSVDLTGWHVTDNLNNLNKWTFPTGLVIKSKEYILILASGKDRQNLNEELHTNFKLARKGEDLALVNPNLKIEHKYENYPPQMLDVSYGYLKNTLTKRYFVTPTPGAENAESKLIDAVSNVKFSVKRGFKNTPFNLKITTSTNGAVVYVTTDGTMPTESNNNASIYNESDSMEIRKTSIVRAAAYKSNYLPSSTETHTYIFLDDVIRQCPDGNPPSGWPQGPIGEQKIDYGMDPDIVYDPLWGTKLRDALTSISTISMVANLDNLFNPETGIYTNAHKSFERVVSIELIYPDNKEGFQIEAGVRARGNFSAQGRNPKHSFRLFFRSKYGDAKLDYPLFGETSTFDKLDLRSAQNDSWAFHADSKLTFIHDVFARDLQMKMHQPYTRSKYHHLYINGLYWGIYQSQERSDASYGANYFGGLRSDYDTIKSTGGEIYQTEVTDGNLDAWTNLWLSVRAGVAKNSQYFKLQGLNTDGTRNANYPVLLDVDNLIDYMLGIFYTGDEDRGLSRPLKNNKPNNFFALRNRIGNRGFSFFAQDAEQSLISKYNIDGLESDRTGPFVGTNINKLIYSNPHWIHQDLMANLEYRVRFGDRAHQYFFNNGLLTPESVMSIFLKRASEINIAIIAESARWGDAAREQPYTRTDWQNAIDNLVINYFPFRSEIVLNQLMKAHRFENDKLIAAPLYPSIQAPLFSKYGGLIKSGFKLSITSADNLDVFYSIDNKDPREMAGGISSSAIHIKNNENNSDIVLDRTTHVMARARSGLKWSALSKATFVVD